MKKLLILFCVWLPGMYAGGDLVKVAPVDRQKKLSDREDRTLLAGVGCSTVSVVGCGVYMGGLCMQEGLLVPTTVMGLGAGTACVGIAGAVACAMCGGHYAQQARELAIKPPVVVRMVRDIGSQTPYLTELPE
jgi:hypothetical protein